MPALMITTELLAGLRDLLNTTAAPGITDESRAYINAVHAAANGILTLPELAIPMDRSDELADARDQLRHAREDFDAS